MDTQEKAKQAPIKELEKVKEWIAGMSNFEVAYQFYSLIEDKNFEEIYETGEYMKIIVCNKKDSSQS